MARRSKFTTPHDAATWAISKGAPARGNKWPITSHTRGLVKFWLTASGISSERAGTLTLAEMTEAWHDLTGATLLRLAADLAPVTPSPIITEQKDNPMPMQEPIIFDRPTPRPAQPAPQPMDQDARMKALLEILNPATPALDEAAILEIVTRHMGATISAATTSATEMARLELEDLLTEARAIVNGAPRTLRIEIAGRVKEMGPAKRHPLFDTLLTLAVISKEPNALHPMLVGPAGSGKTTAAQQVAEALGLSFYSNGALTGAHELTGYKDAAGAYHGTPFRQAFQHGGVYLADEMDRSDPAAVLSLNSALANRFMAFPDQAEPVRAHDQFYIIAACNTFGRGADRIYIGANQMDGASLDRFGTITWDYDEELERAIAGDDAWTAYVQAARAAAADLKIRHVISPRASYYGAIMRRAKLSFDFVAEAAIWKGLDREQRERITARIPDRIASRAQAPIIHAIAAE
jgi:cobaltochelatase CobS